MKNSAANGLIRNFELRSSIPVLRMLDESMAKAFYVDFLGFKTDWEHRFGDEKQSPLYLQIHQGESVLHLNGHADEQTPPSEVRIPVKGLQEYCNYLGSKQCEFPKPEVVDPRYEGRDTDMNMLDPSGNHLVFWTPSYLAVE